MILVLLSKGSTNKEIIEDSPDLEEADIKAALSYAHRMLTDKELFNRQAV